MRKILIIVYQKITKLRTQLLPIFFVKTPFLSSLYYLLFSNKFKREQQSVLKGKLKYLRDLKEKDNNFFTLIRNIHRIEKGLIMKQRRTVFAVNFITETVESFFALWTPNKALNNVQFQWFYDVLNEYFNLTGDHEVINKERVRFREFTEKYNRSEGLEKVTSRVPFKRVSNNRSNITYEQFRELTYFRRSVRWFLDKKVPHELIDKALITAKQSPSACNRQPFKFRVFDDPELLKEVAGLPMGVKGYVEGIPMMIVVTGNLDAYFDERDRHIIYIDSSLASMTFMYALETLGLSSCAINWPDIEHLEKKIEKILDIQKYERVIMCMAVGYPDLEEKVAYSGKKDLKDIRTYNI